jgi:murein DD-endopeptidase MepM/ murein hydrolase activator NlpD
VSAIADGIRQVSRTPKKPGTTTEGPQPRGGLMDLLLALIAVYAMVSRTSFGGLLWYGAELVRGHDEDLPSLTAYFSNGVIVTPDDLVIAMPTPDGLGEDQLPEPFRTAARTTLAQEVPPMLGERLTARGVPVTEDSALVEIDALWKLHRDAPLVLEIAAIGAEQRDRAVARATSAGETNPETYPVHRRYLPGDAALQADRFVGGTLALATALDLTWPLEGDYRMTSPFGDRKHPILGSTKMHDGVDLAVPIGTPVRAAQKGTVAVVGESSASGRYVVLDHGYGVHTAYCHLSTTPVAQGAPVGRAEPFALSGNTGRSTGPHLHYGIKIGGRWVDPERFKR